MKETTMLTIYGVPISVHTRKVIVTALNKGIDYENEPVIPFDPPLGWRAKSPTGLIPAITDDGFTLADSNAICAYLERIHPAHPVYPEEPGDCGRALWLEQYATTALFRDVVQPLFHQKVIRPHILKQGGPDEGEIARVTGEVAPVIFGYLEDQVAGEFLADGTMTIADIAVASNLINYQYLGFALHPGRYPKLAAAFRRTIAEPAFAKALAAETPFAEQMGLDRSFLN
jgi:glutathione S-transferase